MKWLGMMLTAALLAMAPGYGSAQPVEGKSASPATQPKNLEKKGEQAQAAKSYSPKERQAYQQKVAADLANLQQKIDDLHGKYEMARPQMKRTTLRVLHTLKKQLSDTQNQLTTLKEASEKDWGDLKVEMDKAMQGLTQSCQEAESRLQ